MVNNKNSQDNSYFKKILSNIYLFTLVIGAKHPLIFFYLDSPLGGNTIVSLEGDRHRLMDIFKNVRRAFIRDKKIKIN
jgi:hypothetical protein